MDKFLDPTRPQQFWFALLEAVPDALVVADAEGNVIFSNAQAEKLFGYSRAEFLGKPIEMLMPERFRAAHVENRAAYLFAPSIRRMSIGRELVALRRDGTEFPLEMTLSPFASEFGQLTIAIARDVTERRQTEDRLRYLGGHDTLTGLYNRHAFEEQQSRLARGRQFPVSIVVVDLDTLKETNDLFGHAAGDEMLKRAATVLVQAFRADDTIARMGGDEFAALLPSTGRQAAAAAVDRVARCLRRHNAVTQGPTLNFSIGVATVERGQSLAQCVREADLAMYQNKLFRAGRARGLGGA
jgi:diguanylate cyclase (GGDEF)-like protein/PAS domain S-box-containing protein